MPQTFRDLIAENKQKSVTLVIGFCLFIAVMGVVLCLAILFMMGVEKSNDVKWERAILVGLCAAVGAFLFSLLGYYSGDKWVLGVAGAHPLEKPQDPQLYNVVEEMAIAAGLPMPKIYLIVDDAPNAFATGRSPETASVAITTGLRRKLNREELQGVIAHEMAHIRNYDIRLMLLLAVLIGTVVMLSDLFWQFLRFGGRSSSSSNSSGSSSLSSNNDGKKGGGGAGILMLVIVVLAILFALIAPLLARMIQLAVSRQREYLADASAVELTRNPTGLADALKLIDDDPTQLKSANRGIAHLFIANPIKKFSSWSDSIFSSHPPTRERIARIDSLLGEYPQKAIGLPSVTPNDPKS